MPESRELSPVDLKILALLQEDASLTAAEIAEQVSLSPSPCWRRIQRMEKEGYIEKRVALLNGERLGMGVVIFASISLSANDEQSLENFEAEIQQFPEVVECYTVTGTMDYFLKIITRDIRGYEAFLRQRLLQVPLIRELHSNVAVTKIKFTTSLPLATQLD
jgi:Lrp/AsnC family transcriptional regulator